MDLPHRKVPQAEGRYGDDTPQAGEGPAGGVSRGDYILIWNRSVIHAATALTTAATPASTGSITSTSDQATGGMIEASGLSVPSMTNILPAANAPKATTAPISPAKIASRTNGAWMNQLAAPTGFITETSRRLLYAATWIVLPTSSSAARPWIPAMISPSVCNEPRMLNSLLNSS